MEATESDTRSKIKALHRDTEKLIEESRLIVAGSFNKKRLREISSQIGFRIEILEQLN